MCTRSGPGWRRRRPLAVKASPARVAGWLEGTSIDIAAINGPEAVVVAGARAAIDALAARLRAEGAMAQSIAVSHASHSRLMDPILGELNDAIADVPFHAPTVPIIANLSGRLAAAGEYDARYWCRHLREPVRFHEGAAALRGLDIDVCLEIGPDRTLVNLLASASLLPAGGGLASLRRGASDRESVRAAMDGLREQGHELARGEARAAATPSQAAVPLHRAASLSRLAPVGRRAATAASRFSTSSATRSPHHLTDDIGDAAAAVHLVDERRAA